MPVPLYNRNKLLCLMSDVLLIYLDFAGVTKYENQAEIIKLLDTTILFCYLQ